MPMYLSPELLGPVLLVICLLLATILSSRTLYVQRRNCPHAHELKIHEYILYCLIRRLTRSVQWQADKFLDLYHYFCCCDLQHDPTLWQLAKFMGCKLMSAMVMKMALKYFSLLDWVMGGLVRCLRSWITSPRPS